MVFLAIEVVANKKFARSAYIEESADKEQIWCCSGVAVCEYLVRKKEGNVMPYVQQKFI